MSRTGKRGHLNRSSRRACTLATTVLALGGSAASVARADDSPFCRQTQARAASDASLLMMPRLVLQELRYPHNSLLDDIPGSGFVFRAGLSYSFVDLFKGFKTLDIGDATCLDHEAKMGVKDRLDYARDVAQLAALGAEVAFLQQRKSEWEGLLSKAGDRLTRRVITVIDFTRIQQLANALDRKLAQVEGEVTVLRARVPRTPGRPLGQLVAQYQRRNANLERKIASSRALDPWQLRVSGGVIAQTPLDWYGMAELSVSFSAFLRPAHERAYERARAEQLANAPDELPAQVRALRAQTQASTEQARHELNASQRSVLALAAARRLLENFEAENVLHARDALTIESIAAEAEVVFLTKLIDALNLASE